MLTSEGNRFATRGCEVFACLVRSDWGAGALARVENADARQTRKQARYDRLRPSM